MSANESNLRDTIKTQNEIIIKYKTEIEKRDVVIEKLKKELAADKPAFHPDGQPIQDGTFGVGYNNAHEDKKIRDAEAALEANEAAEKLNQQKGNTPNQEENKGGKSNIAGKIKNLVKQS